MAMFLRSDPQFAKFSPYRITRGWIHNLIINKDAGYNYSAGLPASRFTFCPKRPFNYRVRKTSYPRAVYGPQSQTDPPPLSLSLCPLLPVDVGV